MVTEKTSSNRKWFVLTGSTLLYLATTADGPNFNAALPAIQDYFSATTGQIQLLTTVAQLCVAAFVLAAGSLGDLYGRKRVFLLGGVGLIATLVLQALSPSIGFLTVMRGLDGVFSAITTPLAVAMITMEFQGKERSYALGIFTAAVGLGEAFLPLLAGWLTDSVSWRATFLISITTATLAFLIIRQNAQEAKDPQAQKLDIGGVIFSAIMMLGFVGSFLMAGNRGFANPAVLIAMVVGLIFLFIFIWWEKRTPNPALHLSLFRNPVFLSAFVAGFGVFFVLMPLNPLMQLYFQDVLAYSALAASMALIPLSLGTTLSGPFAGKLTARLGTRNSILTGISIMLVGTLLLSTLGLFPPYWVVGLGLALVAVGYGLTNPPRVDALMSAAPDDIAGSASSSNSVGTESGSAAGMALSTTLAMVFAGRAFVNLGTEAGLSSDQIQQAIEVLRKVISDGLTTYPGISQSTLDQLFEGAQTAYSTGVAQTMLLLTAVLLISGIAIWFGMRKSSEQSAIEES
jgi:MFS family permease